MSKKEQITYLLGGTIWMIIGVVLFIYQQQVIQDISLFLGLITYFGGILKFIFVFLPSKKIQGVKQRGLLMAESLITVVIGTWIFNISQFVPKWLIRGIGLYQLFMGVISLINFYLLRKDRVKGRLKYILLMLINFIWGLSSLMNTNMQSTQNSFRRLAIYLIFVGITVMMDGSDYFLSEPIKHKIKRRIRIPLPVIFNMFTPKKVLDKINKFLYEELSIENFSEVSSGMNTASPVFKVFIHVGESGPNTMGHVDISYRGSVYAYGNYDVDSERLFGSIGDGVLFSLNEKEYIEYCMQDQITMFEYQVILTDEQIIELEKQLEELMQLTVEWRPSSSSQLNSYIGVMHQTYEVQSYKFVSSRYKTYFVLGTNCVLLADQLIGASGLDLIAMVGVLAPGTYYEYFEEEYKKPHSIVVGKVIHHPRLSSVEVS